MPTPYDLIQNITERLDNGEIVGICIQYMTPDGKMWMKTIDGDFPIPDTLMKEADMQYQMIIKRGN